MFWFGAHLDAIVVEEQPVGLAAHKGDVVSAVRAAAAMHDDAQQRVADVEVVEQYVERRGKSQTILTTHCRNCRRPSAKSVDEYIAFLADKGSQRNLFESKLQRKGDAMQQLGVTLGARWLKSAAASTRTTRATHVELLDVFEALHVHDEQRRRAAHVQRLVRFLPSAMGSKSATK